MSYLNINTSLGDNREVSKDSRAFGLIDEKQIVGKVSLRFWPLTDFKFNFNPDNDIDKR